MPTSPDIRSIAAAASLLALLFGAAAAQETPPPEAFGDEVVVRETSVVALPPGGGELPALSAVTVTVDGIAQRVTRIEPVLEGKRGEWRFVVYLDPRLAGARTRYLSALALAQRAESLAAMGTVEVLVAEAGKPLLERTDSWQRMEAALLSHALEAKHRLARGDAAVERPGWESFRDRLELMRRTLEGHGAGGPRALLLPADGLYAAAESAELDRIGRALTGGGWVVVPMPWSEAPNEASAARLSEFESWRQSAAGRDTSAGTRQYVIDLGRVVQRLRGAGAPPPTRVVSEPQLAALQALTAPSSGLLAGREDELRAALSNLARRWRIWFQTAARGDGELRPLEVRLDNERLAARAWIRSPSAE